MGLILLISNIPIYSLWFFHVFVHRAWNWFRCLNYQGPVNIVDHDDTIVGECWALIRSFFVFSGRSLPDLSDTSWCALVVIHNFELDFTFIDTEVSDLLFSFLHCNFIFLFYLLFLIIAHYAHNLQSLWHYQICHARLYHFLGKAEGVTLSRLDWSENGDPCT